MATLQNLIDRYVTQERPDSLILDPDVLLEQAISATQYYSGYAAIISEPSSIESDTELTAGEWAIIRPLFLLYVERETAVQLEASRIMGIDVFGRNYGEVAADIARTEEALSLAAFYREIVTI